MSKDSAGRLVRRGHASAHGTSRARRTALAAVGLAAVTLAGIGVGTAPASASPVGSTAPTTTTTTTTVVSPTTTVTTTTGAQATTTSTTVVTTSPGSTTSTTTTTVAPTTTTTTTTAPRPATTTTTTTVPTRTAAPAAGGSGPAVPAARVVPKPLPFDTTCSRPATPALQTYLDSLPAGSTFTSSATACYLVPVGILLTRPVNLVGGTFYDPTTTRSPGTVYSALKPIILIKDTSHVSLTDLRVLGANTVGGYHAQLVGQAGVKIMSSLDVTLTGITSTNTWGDGLELVADFTDHIKTPVTRLAVEGFTSINAGRQGITVAEVASSVLDHVNVVSPADAGFDFESDLPGVGSGNVVVANCTNDRGFNMAEYFTGPIVVTNCNGFHHVTLRTVSRSAVSFSGGNLACKRADPVPCIKQDGGSLTFNGVAVSRMPGTIGISEPVWAVASGGNLAFVHSPIASPMGTVVRPASVRFSG
jgi:hypothetical protein